MIAKTVFPTPATAELVKDDSPDYTRFHGVITIRSAPENADARRNVAASVEFENIRATPGGFGTALGMSAIQYLTAIPSEHKQQAVLELIDGFGALIGTFASSIVAPGEPEVKPS